MTRANRGVGSICHGFSGTPSMDTGAESQRFLLTVPELIEKIRKVSLIY